MVVVGKYSHINLDASNDSILKQLAAVDPWVPPVYAITFLANLALTALMMIKVSGQINLPFHLSIKTDKIISYRHHSHRPPT
jgi:hypothetical protein